MSLQITDQISRTVRDLEDCLEAMDNSVYGAPSSHLSGGTIGQHTRHVIELFTCLFSGYESGCINYEKRKRDLMIQTNVSAAINALEAIRETVLMPDKVLQLEISFDDAEMGQINTTYVRELMYNLEHTIHHMALIRVGVHELSCLNLPAHFGVAPGTIKHRKAVCAP